jgi:hypothetical protein
MDPGGLDPANEASTLPVTLRRTLSTRPTVHSAALGTTQVPEPSTWAVSDKVRPLFVVVLVSVKVKRDGRSGTTEQIGAKEKETRLQGYNSSPLERRGMPVTLARVSLPGLDQFEAGAVPGLTATRTGMRRPKAKYDG